MGTLVHAGTTAHPRFWHNSALRVSTPDAANINPHRMGAISRKPASHPRCRVRTDIRRREAPPSCYVLRLAISAENRLVRHRLPRRDYQLNVAHSVFLYAVAFRHERLGSDSRCTNDGGHHADFHPIGDMLAGTAVSLGIAFSTDVCQHAAAHYLLRGYRAPRRRALCRTCQ